MPTSEQYCTPNNQLTGGMLGFDLRPSNSFSVQHSNQTMQGYMQPIYKPEAQGLQILLLA